MKNLILLGDPGVRKGGRIEYDGEELVVFSVNRQGDWHGPDRPHLWCTVGTEDERETFQYQDYVPMHLETEHVDAAAVEVLQKSAVGA